MTDILKRLFGPANIASGTSTLFTGTAAHVYTIKTMTVVNSTGGDINIKIGIGGVTDDKLILPSTAIVAGGYARFDGLMILTGAETLQANVSATGLTVAANGLDQS